MSIKLFIPASPHLTGFFKGSQMLQQTNIHVGAMTREHGVHAKSEMSYEILFLRRWPAFWLESQMPDWSDHILGQIPLCTKQNSSQMPGVCLVLELTGKPTKISQKLSWDAFSLTTFLPFYSPQTMWCLSSSYLFYSHGLKFWDKEISIRGAY